MVKFISEIIFFYYWFRIDFSLEKRKRYIFIIRENEEVLWYIWYIFNISSKFLFLSILYLIFTKAWGSFNLYIHLYPTKSRYSRCVVSVKRNVHRSIVLQAKQDRAKGKTQIPWRHSNWQAIASWQRAVANRRLRNSLRQSVIDFTFMNGFV